MIRFGIQSRFGVAFSRVRTYSSITSPTITNNTVLDTKSSTDQASVSSHDNLQNLRNILSEYSEVRQDGVLEAPDLADALRVFKDIQNSYKSPKDVSSFEYKVLINLMTRYQRPNEEIIGVMELLKEQIKNGANVSMDDNFVAGVLRGLVNNKMLDPAKELLKLAEQSGLGVASESYVTVLKGCADESLRSCLRVPKENVEKRLDILRRSTAYMTANELIKKYPFRKEIEENGVVSHKLFHVFVRLHAKILDVNGCKLWLEHAKKLPLDELTPLYNSLLELYCRLGQMMNARGLIQEMKSSKDKKKLYPNSFTYGCLLHADGRLLHMSLMDIINEMKKTGVSVTTKTWNIILWKKAVKGRIQDTEHYFEKMLQTSTSAPDRDSYAARIVAYAENVRLRADNETTMLVAEDKLRARLAKTKKKDLVEQYFEKVQNMVEEYKTVPNSKFLNTYLLFSLAAGKFSLGKQYAQHWLNELANNPKLMALQVQGQDLNALHNSLLNPSNHLNVDISRIAQPKTVVDSISFNLFMASQLNLQQEEEAWKIFSIMETYTVMPDEMSYTLLLKYHMKRRNAEKCHNILQQVEGRRLQEGGKCTLIWDKGPLDNCLKMLLLAPWSSEETKQLSTWLRNSRRQNLTRK
ncbi:hypothetical protein MP638_001715 [Amoeboaphelidium occidentale]|nr:hypothetical protein MP638_001715 [Amoeboaphelidium occidentale]